MRLIDGSIAIDHGMDLDEIDHGIDRMKLIVASIGWN
jgi:hypothetical protein